MSVESMSEDQNLIRSKKSLMTPVVWSKFYSLDTLAPDLREYFKSFGVTKFCDSKESVSFHVNDHDRAMSTPQDPKNCAMAQCCRRLGVRAAWVGFKVAYLLYEDSDFVVRHMVPETVTREMTSFDRHQDFAVGIYRLSKVSPSRRINKRRESAIDSGAQGPRPNRGARAESPRIDVIQKHFTTRVRSGK